MINVEVFIKWVGANSIDPDETVMPVVRVVDLIKFISAPPPETEFETCPSCAGSGAFDNPPDDICSVCNGSGERPLPASSGPEQTKCPTCDGQKKVHLTFSSGLVDCPDCAKDRAEAKCWCAHCESERIKELPLIEQAFARRFIVCPDCGNKRCPKATCHTRACTNSNDPDQDGSRYGTDGPCSAHDRACHEGATP